ncbi:glycerol uptake facilitator GlpF [Salmonella enterica subsp. enterica]|uniref:Glycerol uptake facilitator GlpF n=1 Tax=Salmonella enterica I TaxID=59201 RepID=A0A447U0S0_SALET|nr:glycerol uptake facilitator GlpF [Salmonella enterica subsp. enterica]
MGFHWPFTLTAGISGGHLNPAVTIALWLFACFPKQKVLPYIIAQFAGAFGGALLAYVLYSSLFTEFETAHHMVRGSVESLQLASIFQYLSGRSAKCMAGCVGGSGHYVDSDGHDHGIDG